MRYGYMLMRTDYNIEAQRLGLPICDGIYTTKKSALENLKLAAQSLGNSKSKRRVEADSKSVVYQNSFLITRYRVVKQPINVAPWDNNAETVRIWDRELA